MEKEQFISKLDYYNLNSTFQEVYEYVKKYKNFSFDFETAGLVDLSPITVSFVIRDSRNKYLGFVVDMRDAESLDLLNSIFNESDLVICHNLSFDLRVLYLLGYDIYKLIPKVYDTMLALYVLNTEQKKGLKDFIGTYEQAVRYEDVIDVLNFNLEKFKFYNLKDSYYTYLLYEKTFSEIREKGSSSALFLEINMALFSIYMMERGIFVDFKYLESLLDYKYRYELELLEQSLKTIARDGYSFDLDLNSRNNIVDFFSRYIIKDKKLLDSLLTEKGNLSISSENIEYLLENYELEEKQSEFLKIYQYYKELRKIIETYSKETFSVNELNSRVYSQINSSGTRTARMTITNPPLQTIPSNELGRLIRRSFCSKKENNFLVIDLSQLELRILVHYIGRNSLIEKYNSGIDLHTQTSELLGISRKEAKVVNFMIIYGGGPDALSRKLGIKREQAVEYIQNYIYRIEGYKELKSLIARFCLWNGYIRLPLGYYRYLSEDVSLMERVGFNSLIQTTASIYVKFGMYLLLHLFKDTSGLLLQIHDELLIENSREKLEIIFRFLKRIYERMFIYLNKGTIGQNLDFKIEGKIGSSWLDCK